MDEFNVEVLQAEGGDYLSLRYEGKVCLVKFAQFAEERLDMFERQLHVEVGLLNLLQLAFNVFFKFLQKLCFLVFNLVPLEIVLNSCQDGYCFLVLRLGRSCPLKR